MYDPAIWLADVRLRGNSEEIGMLLEVVHNDNDKDDDDIDDGMHIWERRKRLRSQRGCLFHTREWIRRESIMRLIVIR